MKQIIINEFIMVWRTKIIRYVLYLFIASLTIATWSGIAENKDFYVAQQNAAEKLRERWENLDSLHPHSAVHYGMYAFKPIGVLTSIDQGINAVTGNVLRMEGHRQNEMMYSESAQSLFISQYGKFRPSLILQFVLPLLLILLSIASMGNEKETSRLKLLLVQGATQKKLVYGKAISFWLIGTIMLMVTIATQVVLSQTSFEPDVFQRLLLLFLSYSIYYFFISLLAVIAAALLKTRTSVISFLLTVFLLWTTFLPKIFSSITENIYTLPTRQEFQTAMKTDREKGIDGHNPTDKREKELREKILGQYKVDSLSDLPINYDGLIMQADEEFGNKVWDSHFNKLYAKFDSQRDFYRLLGFINPFSALQNASMGLSGSDMFHHLEFFQQAEQYRRYLIAELNNKHIYGGSKTGDWDWFANNEFYKSIEDFRYNAPPIKSILGMYILDIFQLALWVLICMAVIKFFGGKVAIV